MKFPKVRTPELRVSLMSSCLYSGMEDMVGGLCKGLGEEGVYRFDGKERKIESNERKV